VNKRWGKPYVDKRDWVTHNGYCLAVYIREYLETVMQRQR
jgi:hypothetical protein